MKIDTDHDDMGLRGQSVGFRTCKVCGKTFAKDMQHPKRQKCPECVSKDGRCAFEEKTPASFRDQKRSEEIEAAKRRERQRKRDEAFDRWERENGVKPRIDDHGTCIVEIRGQSCIGCHAVSSVNHS